MSNSECRWGFVSTAGIARKCWKAISLSGNGRVSAVASRSTAKAQQFIDECQSQVPLATPAVAVGSYEELFARDDVDAVYIPLPTGIRKQWVIKAAEAGKHVLVEKPVAINAKDASEMIEACEMAGVQFMDGVMFDHSRRLAAIRETLAAGDVVGKLRRIYAHFSFAGDTEFQRHNIRTNSELEPQGCLGDLGWYCIRFILWAADLQMPTNVSARVISTLQGDDSDGKVPGELSAELQFADGLSASFYCSFITENQQTAIVSGTKGYLTVEDYVLPFYDAEAVWNEHQHVLEIDNCRWNFRRHTNRRAVPEYAAGEPNAAEVNMVRTFGQSVVDNNVDPSYAELTLKTQRILDACLKSDASGGKQIQP